MWVAASKGGRVNEIATGVQDKSKRDRARPKNIKVQIQNSQPLHSNSLNCERTEDPISFQ